MKPGTRNPRPEAAACRVHLCPRCRTQNFATAARVRQALRIPLCCWKCGERLQEPGRRQKNPRGKKGASGRKR